MNGTEIYLFGINHKSASVELREKVAFNQSELESLLPLLTAQYPFSEACILSTCNRSEIYVIGKQSEDVRTHLEKFLLQHRPEITEEDLNSFYFYQGEEVIRHLYQVTAGLDSMVLGEPQIQGQVKDAAQLASQAGGMGVFFHRLFDMALQAAKRVRTETGIAEGAVSVAYAAVELAQKIFKDLSRQKVLLIGSGETGQLVARHLKGKGVETLFITNRTFERAVSLASELGGTAYPFPLMKELLPEIDLVIGAAYAPEYIITREDIEKVLPCRVSKALFLIDIAVPRNFDPEINRFDYIFLNDIDSLEKIVEKNLAKRQQELHKAEKIIDQEVKKYLQWINTLDLTPTIVSLRKRFEKLREEEIKKYQHRVSPEELEVIERVTRGLMNKILHYPLSQLRRYSNGHTDGLTRIEVVRELFNLEVEDEA
ncbi:MAG: glutamyl-tRNA reductase [Calditrichaeota bacterium]|nr:MAG: glutamyl-tRNA reductase [Calditrichota bacterium]